MRAADRSLWLHLVSDHADPMAVIRSSAENEDQHEHEHRVPGPIRYHPVSDLTYSPESAKVVLAELVEDS